MALNWNLIFSEISNPKFSIHSQYKWEVWTWSVLEKRYLHFVFTNQDQMMLVWRDKSLSFYLLQLESWMEFEQLFRWPEDLFSLPGPSWMYPNSYLALNVPESLYSSQPAILVFWKWWIVMKELQSWNRGMNCFAMMYRRCLSD